MTRNNLEAIDAEVSINTATYKMRKKKLEKRCEKVNPSQLTINPYTPDPL